MLFTAFAYKARCQNLTARSLPCHSKQRCPGTSWTMVTMSDVDTAPLLLCKIRVLGF